MGSATVMVSDSILSMEVALLALATAFGEVEGDASGAVGWLPLITIESRVIPLLVASSPLETAAAGAVGGTAPLASTRREIGVATEARFSVTCAHIAAPPVGIPILSLAAVHGLVVTREEEEEGKKQQSAPPYNKHCSLPVREGCP